MSTVVEVPVAMASSATPVPVLSGLGAAIGSDFRVAQNQLVFVEYSAGKVSALNLFSPATLVSSGSTVLKGTFTFDFDAGVEGGVSANADVWWDQQTAVLRQMVPQNSARIINLGPSNFAAVTPNNLEFLPYGTAAIPGSNNASNKLVAGDVFAVRTTLGNYAKVQVIQYGYDLKIVWATYKLAPGYVVLGTGYMTPEDIKLSVDGIHAYVTERTGDFVRVPLANANRSAAAFVVSGMTAPQQIVLDEAHNVAYVVEYAPTGHLWQINLATGAKTAILSNLNFAIGLALSPDLHYAYISEQTTGPDSGRVSRFRLSDGSRQSIVTGLTNPFYLKWADAGCTALFVTERDPANRLTRIDLTYASTNVVATVAPRPSSVAFAAPSRLMVCCDQMIESIDLVSFQPSGPLFMAIGFIPFTDITAAGLADTTADPGAHYPVKNVPFGGTLPIMVNHERAAIDGAAFYRVKIDGVVRMDSWSDEKWNGTAYITETMTPMVVNGMPGFFPVRPVYDLALWLNPALGMLTNSTNLSNSLHAIEVEFVNAAGVLIETSNPVTIRVDNQRCVAVLPMPTCNGAVADVNCGMLHYGTTTALVEMPVVATHPAGFATYSLEVVKGGNGLIGINGPVPAASPVTSPSSTLLGKCTIAAFGEYLYVYASANNGWWRQSQYDASAAIAYALAP